MEANDIEKCLFSLFFPGSLGECVRILRFRLGYTQTEIAEELGINRTHVSRMESNDLRVTQEVLRFLTCKAFDLFIEEGIDYEQLHRHLIQTIQSIERTDGRTG